MLPTHDTSPGGPVLVIDTASRPGYLGLWSGDTWLQFRDFSHGRRQGEEIFPLIEGMLREAHLLPTDLTGVVAVTGPGSFSALRIGLAAAKSLAEVLRIPVVGVTLLDVASSLAPVFPAFCLFPANQSELYLGVFSSVGRLVASPQVLPLSQWDSSETGTLRSAVVASVSEREQMAAHADLASLSASAIVVEHLAACTARYAVPLLSQAAAENAASLDACYVRRVNAGDSWEDHRQPAG